MPIGIDNALCSTEIRVADAGRGFAPYLIVVKRSGVFLEGIGPNVLHASLHKPGKNDPSIAECHIKVAKDARSRVELVGFEGHKKERKNLFKWFRKIPANDRDVKPERAISLVFPIQYAKESWGLDQRPGKPGTVVLAPVPKARIVDVWFGRSEAALRSYLERFSRPIQVVHGVDDELVAIAERAETTRDYDVLQPATPFRSYGLEAKEGHDPGTEEYTRISVGPLDRHAMALVHGPMRRIG